MDELRGSKVIDSFHFWPNYIDEPNTSFTLSDGMNVEGFFLFLSDKSNVYWGFDEDLSTEDLEHVRRGVSALKADAHRLRRQIQSELSEGTYESCSLRLFGWDELLLYIGEMDHRTTLSKLAAIADQCEKILKLIPSLPSHNWKEDGF